MKVSALLGVLGSFESATMVATGLRTPSLDEFRQIFVGREEETVASLVKKLMRQRDLHGRGSNAQPIAKLRGVLTRLEECLHSAGAKKAADDLATLAELLEGCGQPSVGALVSDARGWLLEGSRPQSKSRPPKGLRKKITPPTEALGSADYAALLKQKAKDNRQFDEVIERLRMDRGIKKLDMREIAQLFLGYELAKKKGREDALREIIERQTVEARQDARGSLVDRLKAW